MRPCQHLRTLRPILIFALAAAKTGGTRVKVGSVKGGGQ